MRPMRYDMPTWQFVRLMVALEARTPPVPLFDAWRTRWRDIDQRLTQLAAIDADGFSIMMMQKQVTVDFAQPAQLSEALSAVDQVSRQLEKALRGGGDPDYLSNLRYESRALAGLRADLVALRRGEMPPSHKIASHISADNFVDGKGKQTKPRQAKHRQAKFKQAIKNKARAAAPSIIDKPKGSQRQQSQMTRRTVAQPRTECKKQHNQQQASDFAGGLKNSKRKR